MNARAALAVGAQQQGYGAAGVGRYFAAGTRGHAEPLHQGDPGGLWLFTALDEGRVIVPRAALKLDGEKAPRPVPADRAGAWRSFDDFLNGGGGRDGYLLPLGEVAW